MTSWSWHLWGEGCKRRTILCVLNGGSRNMFSPSHRDQSRWKPSYIKGMFEGISEHLDELGRTSKRSCVNELGRTSKRSCVRQGFAQQRRSLERTILNALPNHPDWSRKPRAAWPYWKTRRIVESYGDTCHSRAATCWQRSNPTCTHPVCDDQEQSFSGEGICTKPMGVRKASKGIRNRTVMDEENWADLRALTAAEDPTLEFGQIAKIREKARKAFVGADMSSIKSPKSYREEERTNLKGIWCWRSCLFPDWSTGMVLGFSDHWLWWSKGSLGAVQRNASLCSTWQVETSECKWSTGAPVLKWSKAICVWKWSTRIRWRGPRPSDSPGSRKRRWRRRQRKWWWWFFRPITISTTAREMSRETTGEPEMEHIPSSRRRSAESIAEGPLTSRRRISSSGQSPTESRATESRAERPWRKYGEGREPQVLESN